LHRLDAAGFAAGQIEGIEYDTRIVQLEPFARLVVYSDGVYEIARPDGPMWKLDEFVEFVSGLPREEPVADRLLTHVRGMHGQDMLVDDFSVLEVRF
jgi:phosphoserine phosphatase RsbU/P